MITLASNRFKTVNVSHSQQSGTNYASYSFPNPFGAYISGVEMFFIDTSVSNLNDPGHVWKANEYIGEVGGNYFGFTWSCDVSDVDIKVYRQTNLSGTRDAFFVLTQ